MSNNKPYLSVIIPCYNETNNLKKGVLEEVDQYLDRQEYTSEVIVSDDGSTDGSLELVRKFVKHRPRFRLLNNKHAGKPFAVQAGLVKAGGEIILFTDMDQSTPIDQVARLLPYFDRGFEIVIGSRGQARKGFSLWRQIASAIFRLIRQTLLLREIVDTQCGFKAFEKKAIIKIFSKMTIFKDSRKVKGWRVSAYDVELLFVAQKMGLKIKETEVNWQDRDVSVSKGRGKSFVKESGEMLKEILRVKLNDIRGAYDQK